MLLTHKLHYPFRFRAGQGSVQLRLLPGGGPEEVAREVDGPRGTAAGQVHSGIRHLVVWRAPLGDHDARQPAIPRSYQSRSAPVCHRRGKTGQTRQVPL